MPSWFAVVAIVLTLFTAGCGRGKPLEPLTVEEITAQAPAVFKDAKPEVRQHADAALASLQRKDFTTAWNDFQALMQAADLSRRQREFAARAVATLSEQMRAAAAAGDAQADAALQLHRVRK